ncbi:MULTISPECIES: hypothetical protein [Methylobacterium]|uniref:hypothetical protein n=1 Tax=Methylobacterium TaxID=407 RepID=UPI00272E5F7B|nr:hypothetical protein [Methylobacterium sp.]
MEGVRHRPLDRAFREDEILARNEKAARNFALIRRIALDHLRRDPIEAAVHTKSGWPAGVTASSDASSALFDILTLRERRGPGLRLRTTVEASA